MPYNPGVVDRSGEILAQSRLAGGNALLQGLTSGIETYKKNRLQNQILTGENDALLAGLQQLQGMQGGAAIANLAPAGMNKLVEKHTQGGGLGLNESMQLNAMLNTTLKTAQAGQQMQAQQLNQQVAAQQLKNEIFKGKQAQNDVTGLGTALKEIAAMENPTQAQIFGALSRQNLSPGAMDQFSDIFGKTAPKAPGLDTARFLRDEKDAERKARIENRANALAMGQQTEALADVNEENAARVLAARTSEAGERKTQEEVVDPDTGRKTTFNVVRDITGKEVSRVPATAPVLSPQQQAEAAGMVKEAENDVAWNEQFRSSVSGSSTRLAQNKYLVSQLRSGKVETGPTTQAKQAIGRVFASFGGNPDQIKDVADYGLAVNILSNQLLDYFAKTKGAISDFETKRFIEFAANPAKTTEENIAILEMMIKLEERNSKALEALRESKARTPAEKRTFIEDYVRKNPLDFGDSAQPNDVASLAKAELARRNAAKKK